MRLTLLALSVAALVGGCASTPPEADPVQLKLNDLDARITRIERIVANQVEVAQRLDEVQSAVRQLRGRLEELEHGNEALARQQRDLYADLDKRLAAASGAAGGAATGSATGETAAQDGATTPGETPGAAAGNAPSSVEQTVYSQAFDALKAGSYSVAITGFKDFLANYPSSPLAENAQYWLGETYYVNHEYDAAAGAFRSVLQKWPDSRKAPDAMLKLGYTQLELKKVAEGRATLTEVTRKFPDSEAAKLARERLRRVPPR